MAFFVTSRQPRQIAIVFTLKVWAVAIHNSGFKGHWKYILVAVFLKDNKCLSNKKILLVTYTSSYTIIHIAHNDKQTNKQEHGVDTPKFEHNTLKKGDKKVSS